MLCGVWMVSPNASEAYVDGSQSLRRARNPFTKVCLNSLHLYSHTLLISTPQSDAGLRSKTNCAHVGTITVTSATCLLCGTFRVPGINCEHLYDRLYSVKYIVKSIRAAAESI